MNETAYSFKMRPKIAVIPCVTRDCCYWYVGRAISNTAYNRYLYPTEFLYHMVRHTGLICTSVIKLLAETYLIFKI